MESTLNDFYDSIGPSSIPLPGIVVIVHFTRAATPIVAPSFYPPFIAKEIRISDVCIKLSVDVGVSEVERDRDRTTWIEICGHKKLGALVAVRC